MNAQPQAAPLKYRWRVPEIDLARRKALRQALGISRITAQVLLNRGCRETAAAEAFLNPAPDELNDPFLFRDMRRAVARIEKALAQGEKITVYGDYDVDGISGAALLGEFFTALGHPVEIFIPDRFKDGYGLAAVQVERLAAAGVGLIITVDNGTSAYRAAETAAALGVDVIVTDHHEVKGDLPDVYAVLNPHRLDGTYPDKRLCGAGVAFKLCHALLAERGEGSPARIPDRLMPLLDLVALGTVADVAPLTGENRVLVREGLKLLSSEARVGIKTLKAVAGLAGEPVGAGQVGFHLGPRINAGGRVADGNRGAQLLATTDPEVAMEAARYLDAANRERRDVESAILAEVVERIDAEGWATRNCIVMGQAGWHPGVLGIIASRVVERYHRPCLLIGVGKGGIGKGSGRSIPALHLFEALGACEDLLLGYGGHMYAAGVSVEADQIPKLAERLDQVVGRDVAPGDFQLSLKLDASARIDEISQGLLDEFSRVAPFGSGNPEPVLMLAGVRPTSVRVVGGDHLKMMLSAPGERRELSAIAFGCAEWLDSYIREGVPVDLAGTVSINRYQGRETLQFRIRDLRPAARN
ncbi:MAG: single-stranded-DNA-specific exonuclease RecJ [Leptospirillia bacterium]